MSRSQLITTRLHTMDMFMADAMEYNVNTDEVAMVITHDEGRKVITLQFMSATEISAAELLGYMDQFIEMNMDDPDGIFDDSEQVERIVN